MKRKCGKGCKKNYCSISEELRKNNTRLMRKLITEGGTVIDPALELNGFDIMEFYLNKARKEGVVVDVKGFCADGARVRILNRELAQARDIVKDLRLKRN